MHKFHLKGFFDNIEFYYYESLLEKLLSEFNMSRDLDLILPKVEDEFDESLFVKIEQFKKYFLSRCKIINIRNTAKYKGNIISYESERRSVLKAVHEIQSGILQIVTWKDKINDGNYIEFKTRDKQKNLFYLLKYELYFDYLKLKKGVLNELSSFLSENYAELSEVVKTGSNDLSVSILNSVELANDCRDVANLLTEEQTRKLLGKSRTTLYNWEKRGYIKKHVIGGSVYYFKDEILKKINDN